jgi:hypothetical protein
VSLSGTVFYQSFLAILVGLGSSVLAAGEGAGRVRNP